MEKKIQITTVEELSDFLYALSLRGKLKLYTGKLTGCRCGCRGVWAHWSGAGYYGRLAFVFVLGEMAKKLPFSVDCKKGERTDIFEIALHGNEGFAINVEKIGHEAETC